MIKVSIIVPVYNVENYLKQCLESLINQTLKDIEIICINDGSKDNSLKILQEYVKSDSRIIVIDKENEGQSVARNIGIEKAQGEYLGFVDSDDWVDSDYFEKLYNAAKKYDCDMACAGFKRCHRNRTSVKKKYSAEFVCKNINDKVKLDNLPNDNYVWNKIYRRESWIDKNISFQPGRFYEDLALVIQILHKLGDMIVVPQIYYNYRSNPNSTIRQKSTKHTDDYNWARNELINYANDNNIFLDFGEQIQKKECIKIFGITLMKIYYFERLVKYKLFGFISFAKKVVL